MSTKLKVGNLKFTTEAQREFVIGEFVIGEFVIGEFGNQVIFKQA
jgi:hypothetical protein